MLRITNSFYKFHYLVLQVYYIIHHFAKIASILHIPYNYFLKDERKDTV